MKAGKYPKRRMSPHNTNANIILRVPILAYPQRAGPTDRPAVIEEIKQLACIRISVARFRKQKGLGPVLRVLLSRHVLLLSLAFSCPIFVLLSAWNLSPRRCDSDATAATAKVAHGAVVVDG